MPDNTEIEIIRVDRLHHLKFCVIAPDGANVRPKNEVKQEAFSYLLLVTYTSVSGIGDSLQFLTVMNRY